MQKPITSRPEMALRSQSAALDIGMIADDLTGALDTAAPFALRGIHTVVAISAADIEPALATGPGVIAVNTASRHLKPEVAASAVTLACARLLRANPALLFKKIDSRLKGNIEAETRAMMTASGRDCAIVAPAVPELGRVVIGGKVSGRGLSSEISIAERYGDLAGALDVPDTADEEAMAFIAARCLVSRGSDLAVGARGLAAALASAFSGERDEPAPSFSPEAPVIVAIGSRDPITAAQVKWLCAEMPGLPVIEAPGGIAAPGSPCAPLQLMLCTEGAEPAAEHEVAACFGRTVAKRIVACGARTLVASGGDTALGILRALGISHIRLEGEVEPGMPWSSIAPAGLPPLTLVTKSGGFGAPDALLAAICRREVPLGRV